MDSINPEEVDRIFRSCLGDEDEDSVLVDGVVLLVRLNKKACELHRKEVAALLSQLHPNFFNEGGGWTFLNFSMTKDGNNIWTGLHKVCDELICLGIALEYVQVFGQEIREALPGGVPLIQVSRDVFKFTEQQK